MIIICQAGGGRFVGYVVKKQYSGGKGLKKRGTNKEEERNKFPSSIFMLRLIYIFFLLPIKADREHKDGDTRRAPQVRGPQLTCQKQSTD